MPQALVFVFEAIGSAFAMEMTFTAIALTNIATGILLVGGLAYSASKARQAKQAAKDAYNASQVDRLVNVSSSIAPRELVMGRVRKGGTIIYRGSTSDYLMDLYLVIALAGHEVDAIEDIWLNDVKVTLEGDGDALDRPYLSASKQTAKVSTGAGTTVTLPANYVAGSITAVGSGYFVDNEGMTQWAAAVPIGVTVSGLIATTAVANATVTYQYSDAVSNIRITKHLGQAGQTADASLMAAFPADWTANDTLAGIAYLVVRCRFNESSFPSGLPNVTATLRGAKLYDPRTGLTAWSENPALMLRHVYTHPKFGKSTVTAADDSRFAAAANACDISTVYTVAGVAQPAASLYRASLVLPYGAAARSGMDDLAQAMGGSWAHAGGALFVKAGVYTSPVLTLTDNDLAVVNRNGATESQRPISIGVHRERAQTYNTVKVKIWDAAQDFKQVSLTPLVGAALLERDLVELVQEATYPAVGYAPQAQHIAGIMMRDARDPLTVELPVKLTMYRLEIFDTISVTLSRYGWSAKTFMVLGRAWNADGSLQLTLKETTAAITQMDAGFLAQGFAVNTNLPQPWDVQEVGALTISSGTSELIIQQDGTVQSRMRVSWAQLADISVTQAGQIEVQYRLASSDGAWASLIVPGNETQVLTSEVADGAIYIVRARSKNKLAVSDWNVQASHQIVGKTALPGACSGFTATQEPTGYRLDWTGVTDVDLRWYDLRVGASWATSVGQVVTTSTSLLVPKPAAGIVRTIWVKAVDTSGNASATAVSVSITPLYPPTVTWGAGSTTETAINLAWSASGAIDHAATVIRLGATWAAGVEIYRGPATNYSHIQPGTGTYTFHARHVDMSGNESQTTNTKVVSYTQPAISNDLLTGSISTAQTTADNAVKIDLTNAPESIKNANAIATAAADATAKASAAQAAAIAAAAIAAQAKADLAVVTANAYADGVVDASELVLIADATAKASAAQAAAIAAAALDATAKVGAVVVGGANLMRNSGQWTSSSTPWSSNGSTMSMDATVPWGAYNSMKLVGAGGAVGPTIMRLKPSTQYTVSAMVKGSSALAGGSDSNLHIQSWTDESSGNVHQDGSVAYSQDITTSWKLVYQTFITPASATLTYCRMYFYPLADGFTLNVGYVKLEEGNKATDWTPALEDVAAGISSAATTANWTGVLDRPTSLSALDSAAATALSGKLSAGTSYTMTGVASLSGAGAYKTGTIDWLNGTTLTGTGVAMTAYGIVAAVGGAAQFVLKADGTATFSGTVSAATIVGSKISTAAYGERIEINTTGVSNSLCLYDAGNVARVWAGYSTNSIYSGFLFAIDAALTPKKALILLGSNSPGQGSPTFVIRPGVDSYPSATWGDNTGAIYGHIEFEPIPLNPTGGSRAGNIAFVADHLKAHNGSSWQTMAYQSELPNQAVNSTSTPAFSGLTVGNTANASATVLDWYQEGSWTLAIVGSTSAGTCSYAYNEAKYTRVGNLVTVVFRVSWSGHTGTGTLKVTGLPFNQTALATQFVDVNAYNMGALYTNPLLAVSTATSEGVMYSNSGTGALVATGITTSGVLLTSFTYMT
jgi:hypothetical protein